MYRKLLIKMVFVLIYFFFHSDRAAKIEKKEKMEKKVKIKDELVKLFVDREILKNEELGHGGGEVGVYNP